MPSYFDYLQFDLYHVIDGVTRSDKDGKTLMDLMYTPSFFYQIKDNTQYIIHPDEIMADNFMLALQAFHHKDFKNFTKEGKNLIDNVLKILADQ
jgi:predicted P-loop ATPase/GTPase